MDPSSFEIVNASRIPPRPLAGQRLEDAGQQLEAWKTPQESSWRRLRASNLSPGELLESSWRLTEPSRSLLESLGGVLSGLEDVWGGAGAVLGAYKRRRGDVLGPLEAMLEPSGSQKGPKMEPKMVPNRVSEATRADNCETLIFDDSTVVFMVFLAITMTEINH